MVCYFARFHCSLFGVSCGDNGEPDDSEESKTKEILSPGEQALSVAKKENAALAEAQSEAEQMVHREYYSFF